MLMITPAERSAINDQLVSKFGMLRQMYAQAAVDAMQERQARLAWMHSVGRLVITYISSVVSWWLSSWKSKVASDPIGLSSPKQLITPS